MQGACLGPAVSNLHHLGSHFFQIKGDIDTSIDVVLVAVYFKLTEYTNASITMLDPDLNSFFSLRFVWALFFSCQKKVNMSERQTAMDVELGVLLRDCIPKVSWL